MKPSELTHPSPSTLPDSVRIEPATIEDLPQLVELLFVLFELEEDFHPDREKQEAGLRLILEQPNRGRIFVVKNNDSIIGMANTLITISTALGGFALLLEDMILHPDFRSAGIGGHLLRHVIRFAEKRQFQSITLLTDRVSAESQRFFQKHGFAFSQMIPMRLVLAE